MKTTNAETTPLHKHLPLTRAACAAAGAAALLCLLALSAGCVVAVRPAPIGVTYADLGEVVVAEAPPAAIVEAVGVLPGPGYFWIGGYYHWYGNRWGWVRGHYELPPRRGAVWIGPRYESRAGHRVYIRGFWR
jgi:hypothetical protein